MKKSGIRKKLPRALRIPFGQALRGLALWRRRIIILTQSWYKKIGRERLFLLTVIFFAALSFLVIVEKNFDGEIWDMGSALLSGEEARVNKIPLIHYFNNKYPQDHYSTNIYEVDLMFIPLWQSMVYIGMKIFGSIAFSVRFWLAMIGFSTVIVMYLIGKRIYNQRVGLIAAITLATLPYYVVHIKSGFGYYAIMPLLVLLLFYFFYLAHQKRERKYLYLSGLMIFLILFNGWPTMMLGFQMMLVFILLNFRYKKILQIPKLLRLKRILHLPHGLKVFWLKSLDGEGEGHLLGFQDYLLMLIIGGGLFFVAGLLYAWYFGGDTFVVFEKIYYFWYTSRASWFVAKMYLVGEKFWLNLSNLARSLFWKMPFKETDGLLTTLTTPNYPMLFPFITFSLLIGIAVLIKRRLLFDKLALIWLFFQILGTTILAGFTARNWLFVTPCLALTIGVGLEKTMGFLKDKVKKIYLKRSLIGLVTLAFIFSILSAYYYYFFYFVKHNSFLAKAAKQAEIGKYITSIATPENSLIVLDEDYPTSKDSFYFFTSGKKYETLYYQHEVEKAIGDNEPQNLARWEQKILTSKEKIIYVFNEGNYTHFPYGIKLWQPISMHAFNVIHADLAPAKVIYYANGLPATSIYVVARNNLPLDEEQLKLKKNTDFYFWSEKTGKADYLQIKGPLSEGRISFNDDSLTLIPKIRPGEKLRLTHNYSQINFLPLSNLGDSQDVILESKNIKVDQEGNGLFLASTAPSGYVVYKITNLKPIKEILAQTYPAINHDHEGDNEIKMQFSPNGKKYKTIYKIKSNKKGYWEVPYEKVATHLIKTSSKEIYIKFVFKGKPGEAKLYSQESHPTVFKTKSEGWLGEGLSLKRGLNKVDFQAKEDELDLTFSNKAGISKIRSFGFMEDKEEEEFPPVQLENGLYRLWLAGKTENASSRKETQNIKLEIPEGNSVTTFKLGLGKNDLNTKFKPLDFSLLGTNTIQITKNDFQDINFLDYWAIVENETSIQARDLRQKTNVLVEDPLSLSQKPIYMKGEGMGKKEIINYPFRLPIGKYLLRAIARFQEEEKGEVAQIQIHSRNREETLTTISLLGRGVKNNNEYQEFIGDFQVERPEEEINLKLKFWGQSSFILDRLEIIAVKETIETETSLGCASGSAVAEDREASGNQVIYQDLKASPVGGYILLGSPKLKIEKGDYLALFRIKASDNKFRKTTASITFNGPGMTYDTREIWCSEFAAPQRYQYFSLILNNFDPSQGFGLNSVWSPKSCALWIDKIEIGEVINTYQAEELLPDGITIYDPEAKGQKAVLLQSEEKARGKLIQGTIYEYSSSKIQMSLRLKINGFLPEEEVATLNIYDSRGVAKFQRTVKREDIGKEGDYQNIYFEIKKDPKTPWNFDLDFKGKGEIWIDYVDFVALE